MGSVFSKESNANSGVIQELAQVSGGSGEVMFFESGYEQTIKTTIMWGIKNFEVATDSYEHSLDAKIEGGTTLSFLLRRSPEISNDVMLSCSSRMKDKLSVKKGSSLLETRRFTVKATIHGSQGKETYQMPVKTLGESCEISITKGSLLSLLSDSGSLLLELTVTIFHEKPAVGTKKNISFVSDESVKSMLPGVCKMTAHASQGQELTSEEKVGSKGDEEERGRDGLKQTVDSVADESTPSSLAKTRKVSSLSWLRLHPRKSMFPNVSVNKEVVKKETIHPTFGDESASIIQCLSGFVLRLFCCKREMEIMKREMSFEKARSVTPEELQELIRERKSAMINDANQRRLGDLKKIATMYSRTGINPLELFPREIWEKILDRMKPEDRANMRIVHQIFPDLLENTLVGDTLLPLVLGYKIPLVQKYLAPRNQYWFQATPGRPDLKNLMTLRCVSKTLRDSVDKWFEDRILCSMRNSDENKDKSSPSPFSPRDYDALNSFDLNLGKDFNEVIAWPNRFFLRSIRVEFARFLPKWDTQHTREKMHRYQRRLNAQVDVMNDNIAEFFRKVGDQISYAYLDFSGMSFFSKSTTAYHIVLKWLPLMPNLKWLQLRDALIEDHDFQMESLPNKGELERLDFYYYISCGNSDRVRIRKLVLEANPLVKYFSSERLCRRDHECYTCIEVYKDPLLLSLPLEYAKIGQEWGSGWTVEDDPPEIHINNWNLSRIALTIGKREGKHFYTHSIDFILDFLQRFQTLEKIALHLDHVKVGKKLNFLKLPNLKDFMIGFGPEVTSHDEAAFFFSLQFLLRCGNLRSLVWEDLRKENAPQPAECTLEPVDGMLLDFKSGREDLSESIIWDAFPRLSSVKVKFVEVDADDIYAGRSVQREYRERRLISEDEYACKWEPPVESSSDSDS